MSGGIRVFRHFMSAAGAKSARSRHYADFPRERKFWGRRPVPIGSYASDCIAVALAAKKGMTTNDRGD